MVLLFDTNKGPGLLNSPVSQNTHLTALSVYIYKSTLPLCDLMVHCDSGILHQFCVGGLCVSVSRWAAQVHTITLALWWDLLLAPAHVNLSCFPLQGEPPLGPREQWTGMCFWLKWKQKRSSIHKWGHHFLKLCFPITNLKERGKRDTSYQIL